MVQINQMATRPVSVPSPGAKEQITWSPVAKPIELPFTGTSYPAVRDALVRAFGPFPIRLSKTEHLIAIRAMEAVGGEAVKPYSVLARALEKYSELELLNL